MGRVGVGSADVLTTLALGEFAVLLLNMCGLLPMPFPEWGLGTNPPPDPGVCCPWLLFSEVLGVLLSKGFPGGG